MVAANRECERDALTLAKIRNNDASLLSLDGAPMSLPLLVVHDVVCEVSLSQTDPRLSAMLTVQIGHVQKPGDASLAG